MKIEDILKIDLTEDIKNVIDLEDSSEDEIQHEIESYIITDGLGKHLSSFVSQYTSNIKETGVWISGFYGSGKSYFGKMLGHILGNQSINGTNARDRFIRRLSGIKNESLIENDLRNLDAVPSKVIFLDVAKQNTDNGLAFTLFSNFLKHLGFRNDLYGYMEYELFIEGKLDEFIQSAEKEIGQPWIEIRKSNRTIARAMRRGYLAMGYSEAEFDDTKNVYTENIKAFSSSKLKDELEKYLVKLPDERIVFIFDETSEAISQKKFTLLDLEGISESLSSISSKVWTIAIAQEKLDDVINNANVNKSQLIKVTDRFKTKMHLESTDVDVIIRSRLLQKVDGQQKVLEEYYNKHEGLVSDATNLASKFPTKTNGAKEFATYYPFHKYQFDLLQKFLFSSNALVASQIAARGMIITTFDVLRKQMKGDELYDFVNAVDLCTEAQTAPPADLVNKYDNAKKIIESEDVSINGEKLLKTIHFLNDAELVQVTVENITKSYISDFNKYYEVKPEIEKALEILIESKILLKANNQYKITSSLEGKLLEEMRDINIELHVKKRELVSYLKNTNIFRPIATINDDSVTYNFSILTDLDDEIIGSNNKELRFVSYSLYNINEENRQDFVESIKMETQGNKKQITLIPQNKDFDKIDKLITEVKRYEEMDSKYGADSDQNKRSIIRDFTTIKEEKIKELQSLIEDAYHEGDVVYLYDNTLLDKETFKTEINQVQKRLIKNIYTKKLSTQLSESIGPKLLKERSNDKLSRLLTGEEFKFFDTKGNFIGEGLKVVEEITHKVNGKFIDGKSLEDEFTLAPWGYGYGTILSTLAAMFRAGRLVVKTSDGDYFNFNDAIAQEVFNKTAKFKNARFKAITKSLSSSEKSDAVTNLLDLKADKVLSKKIDYSLSDFEIAEAITDLSNSYITQVKTLESSQKSFNEYFSDVLGYRSMLVKHTNKTTESNYIEKVQKFLEEYSTFKESVKYIGKVEKFIKNNLDKLKGYIRFVVAVKAEMKKAYLRNDIITDTSNEFDQLKEANIIGNFSDIQDKASIIKDEYYELMNNKAFDMTSRYKGIKKKVLDAKHELNSYPEDLNFKSKIKLDEILKYCEDRILEDVTLEYNTTCKDSGYSISDILNFIALADQKENEVDTVSLSFIKEKPPVEDTPKPSTVNERDGSHTPSPVVKTPKRLKLTINNRVMTVAEYKRILSAQLQAMSQLDDDDKVDVEVNA
ncbi:BREX system P-loop protein BrxC [Flammeovirga sp. EKP202]|uniref:BREX system P-loop protein BrxC n=1 Tax=Flammeovirga sp. EKP202 TaxID=2770592 RepID=UPI00165F3ECC|nr:BREX system P-loop protein BrxC [Flammeovirga sp. EKP202]MBD0402937.1 BREX system P-loop protein BrxC [Flammeovirga sp. EKP202]